MPVESLTEAITQCFAGLLRTETRKYAKGEAKPAQTLVPSKSISMHRTFGKRDSSRIDNNADYSQVIPIIKSPETRWFFRLSGKSIFVLHPVFGKPMRNRRTFIDTVIGFLH